MKTDIDIIEEKLGIELVHLRTVGKKKNFCNNGGKFGSYRYYIGMSAVLKKITCSECKEILTAKLAPSSFTKAVNILKSPNVVKVWDSND